LELGAGGVAAVVVLTTNRAVAVVETSVAVAAKLAAVVVVVAVAAKLAPVVSVAISTGHVAFFGEH
jgi:hypothetical protein